MFYKVLCGFYTYIIYGPFTVLPSLPGSFVLYHCLACFAVCDCRGVENRGTAKIMIVLLLSMKVSDVCGTCRVQVTMKT